LETGKKTILSVLFRNVFGDVLYEVRAYTVPYLLTVTRHESGTRKAVSCSVTVYNKIYSVD